MTRQVMRVRAEDRTPRSGASRHDPAPDRLSQQPGRRSSAPAPHAPRRVALRRDDIRAVQTQFDKRLPGSCWCGFASWEETYHCRRPNPQDCKSAPVNDAGAARLVLFTLTDGSRYLTLSRYDDDHLELTNEVGHVVASADHVDALIDVIERPGRR